MTGRFFQFPQNRKTLRNLSWAFSFSAVIFFPILSLASEASEKEKTVVPYQTPLESKEWVSLSYQKIPPNDVQFSQNRITVKVNSSAGPLVHSLPKRKWIHKLVAKGSVVGKKHEESGDFDEDSVFRLGLVVPGKNTLSGPKRWFAASWLKTLFSLAPEGSGIDSVQFLFVSNRNTLEGKSRIHPKSNLLHENVQTLLKKDGTFLLEKTFDPPLEVVALWLSIDGDDSKSQFETSVEEILLNHSL